MTTHEYLLPDPGEGLTEAEILSWHVAVGDTVKVNDIVCEVETAKSVVELPTPYAGTVTALLVSEGETVAVGTPIIAVGDPASPEVPAVAETERASAPTEEPAPMATLVGYGPRERQTVRRRRRTPSEDGAGGASGQVGAAVRERDLPLRTLAKPPVRKLAKDLGVDLRAVPPGEGGIVRRADVEAYAHGAQIAPAVDAPPVSAPPVSVPEPAAAPETSAPGVPARETRVPVKGVRKATAEAMVASAFTAPHVTEWLTVDVSRSMELVERMRLDPDLSEVRVSPLLLVVRAVCLALRRTPEMNATFDGAAQEIVLKHDVHLGIATATPRGLLVPVVRDADRLTMPELAGAIGDVVRTAREGRTQPEALAGGTFSITNVGVFGVDAGTPILVPGQTGILAVGAINRRPWVVDEAVVPRWVTTLAVSFDHRVVDGAQGSRFLADVGRLLEDPASAMTL
ncbi:dihydrolipoamide acetyltransferase family protein [Mumia zhuanghuii]|uniref:Dihydrolipoamide acetyltransferase component of pyruvate dehydrogenase complex n=1 Tax=Mumia zhuanghuii TaxID=2585211 RepID=A0A5C4MS18_9ACTN|nr:dihydrolipoamide acetyltransferase family protein [Mumia zhuanghuii]TNC47035.1 2-oxo acid dehydrogenase subunit E2 [Mumia zhuanghuii]TNC47271.1 2-oxo acid dehydrogenase subunit E2 [Mumia zhuanghuii]